MATRLPKPKGKYAVACADVLTSTGLRGNLFRLYYPTDEFEPTEKNLAWWVDDKTYISGYANFVSSRLITPILSWFLDGQKAPVLWQGPLISSKEKFPVVLFSHGLGGNRTSNSYVCYSIASYGFIVASIEHRDLSASAAFYLEASGTDKKSDGEVFEKTWIDFWKVESGNRPARNMQLYKREDEVSHLLGCLDDLNAGKITNLLSKFNFGGFSGRLDLEKCAVVGHSFGGATTVASLANNDRFKVGVLLDGWMFPLDEKIYEQKIPQPILFINSETFSDDKNIKRMRRLINGVWNPENDRKMITLLGTVHQTQSDFTHIIPSVFGRLSGVRGPTDPQIVNEINTEAVVGFIGTALDLPSKGDIDLIVSKNEFVIEGTNVQVDA